MGRPSIVMDPLPPKVAAALSDTHLAAIASVPEDIRETVATAIADEKLTSQQAKAVVAAANKGGEEAALAEVAEIATKRRITKGMKDAVSSDALVALAGLLERAAHARTFSPEDAVAALHANERDYYASELQKTTDWASEVIAALSNRKLRLA